VAATLESLLHGTLRWLVGVLALAVVVVETAAAGPSTALTIRYQPHNDRAFVFSWTLTCAPPGGTHPRPALACSELGAYPESLLGLARPCPLFIIRGAPEAQVVGRFRAIPVRRIFRPGCGGEYFRPMHVFFTGK
jgi:hypothetical protein